MSPQSRIGAVAVCLWFLSVVSGCGVVGPKPGGPDAGAANAAALANLEINAEVCGFTDNFLTRVSGPYQQIVSNPATPAQRKWALQSRLGQAIAAVTDATGPNPIVNMLDLTVMVTLKRMSIENRAIPELLHEQGEPLLAAYKQSESEIWTLAATRLNQTQVDELHALIDQWWKDNPDQANVGFVRFTNFARNAATVKVKGRSASDDLLSLLYVDPLAGLDPIAKQAQGFRDLAERLTYIGMRMPLIFNWQLEDATQDVMDTPEIQSLVATSRQYGKSIDRFNEIIARYPDDFSDASQKLVVQISKATDAQREATVNDLNNQAKNVQIMLDNARQSIELARDSALQINASTTQTIAAAEVGSRSILDHTLFVVMVLLLVGFLWPAMVLFTYRYCSRRWIKPQNRA
jgi:hypothetical protein